jgi:hypothetical protein
MVIVHILLMAIGGYFINGYWWLFYWRLLANIFVIIGGYNINRYW